MHFFRMTSILNVLTDKNNQCINLYCSCIEPSTIMLTDSIDPTQNIKLSILISVYK